MAQVKTLTDKVCILLWLERRDRDALNRKAKQEKRPATEIVRELIAGAIGESREG